MTAMREVHPSDVHTGSNKLQQRLFGIRLGTDSANYVGIAFIVRRPRYSTQVSFFSFNFSDGGLEWVHVRIWAELEHACK
jgi:hypothetical protein